MKVDSSISNQVLDRIKVSGDHLGEAIYRPGEDRCFKGDALGQLIQQGDSVPEPVIEPVTSEFLIKQPLEEMSEVPRPVVVPVPSLSEHEVKQLESEVALLKERIDGVPSTLDEMRGEIGKLVANSRREQIRIGKRMDQLEQGGGSDSTEVQSLQLREMEDRVAQLQQQLNELNRQQQPVAPRQSAEISRGVEQRFSQLNEELAQSRQAVDDSRQQQAEQAQLMQQLQGALKQTQQLVLEQSRQIAEQSALMQKMQQQIEGSGATDEIDSMQVPAELQLRPLLEPLRQQLAVVEQTQQQLAEQLEQLSQQRIPVTADEGVLQRGDGREKSIVEELRYEIGEVRKSNGRQLEALNSKLHAVTTSAEVNQIVKHATLQLQHKIDDIKQQIRQGEQPVSTAIRF